MRTHKTKRNFSVLLARCAVLYCTVLYCTVLYCTVLYCTVLYCTVLYCTVLYCTVLYCTVLYCTVLYCTVLYCTVLYCTVLYCTVLYCTVLYCTVLYCTVPLVIHVLNCGKRVTDCYEDDYAVIISAFPSHASMAQVLSLSVRVGKCGWIGLSYSLLPTMDLQCVCLTHI